MAQRTATHAEIDGAYLHYHTKVTVLAVGVEAYLCSRGAGNPSSVIQAEEATSDALPRNFERCVWSILPVEGLAPNEKRYAKYGDVVVLQHAKTSRHVTVCTSVPSDDAPNCFSVDFVAGQHLSHPDRCFKILPKYKIRQEGEYIRLKDQVLFCCESSGRRYLSINKEESKTSAEEPSPNIHQPHEVHCAPHPFAWRLRIYDDPTIDPSPIRAGNCVLLYHKETDGFLTAELAPTAEVYMTPVEPMEEVSSESGTSSSSANDVEVLDVPEFGTVYQSITAPSRARTEPTRAHTPSPQSLWDVNEALREGELDLGGARASFRANFAGFRFGRTPSFPHATSLDVARLAAFGRQTSGPELDEETFEQLRRGSGAAGTLMASQAMAAIAHQPHFLGVPPSPQAPPPQVGPAGRWRRKRSVSLPLALADAKFKASIDFPAALVNPTPSIGVTPASPSRLPLAVDLDFLEDAEVDLELPREDSNFLVETMQEYASEFHTPKTAGTHGSNEVFMLRATEDSARANSMWILENAKANYGGSPQFGVAHRLRHVASSSYLTVLRHPVFAHTLQLAISSDPECPSDKNSLFILYPLDADTHALTSTTPVQLQHQASGLYVKRPANLLHVPDARRPSLLDCPMQLPLELSYFTDDDDVFTIHVPSASNMEDVHFVLDNMEALTAFVEVYRGGAGSDGHIATAQAGLERLILFCTSSEDPDPLTRRGVPIVPHQLLLLDTHVHVLVIQLLSAPFKVLDLW